MGIAYARVSPYLDVVVPIPTSVNAVWRANWDHFYQSPIYKAWQQVAGEMLVEQIPEDVAGFLPLAGPLKFEAIIHPGPTGAKVWRSNRDCDNVLKGAQDLFTKRGIILADDSETVEKVSAELGAVCAWGAHARIIVSPFLETRQPIGFEPWIGRYLERLAKPARKSRGKRPARTTGGPGRRGGKA